MVRIATPPMPGQPDGNYLSRLPQTAGVLLQQARDTHIARSGRIAGYTSRGGFRDTPLFPILALLPLAKRAALAFDLLHPAGDSHAVLGANAFHFLAQTLVVGELDFLELLQTLA